MSQASPVVFVVDDDVSIRESLEALLQKAGWCVETFDSALKFLARPPVLVPNCLVLDVALPGLNGLDLQKRVVVERPGMPIIFITGQGDIPMTVQAMKAGAIEFLTKPYKGDVLLQSIKSAVEKSKALLGREEEIQILKARYADLTSRERDVMSLVVVGLLNKQVGSRLGISEITVKKHRGNAMRKMKAESLVELAKMAKRLRLPQAPAETLLVANNPSSPKRLILPGPIPPTRNGRSAL
jgi:FixJ family two-component response regulator